MRAVRETDNAPEAGAEFAWDRLAEVPYARQEALVRWAAAEGQRTDDRWRRRQAALANEAGDHRPAGLRTQAWESWQAALAALRAAPPDLWEKRKRALAESWARLPGEITAPGG